MVMKRYLPESEQARLLKAAKGSSDPLAQRDYHWMAALLLTGMRIGEWSRLTVPQVQQGLRVGWLVSRPEQCKGGRGNEYLVTEQLRVHLVALVRFAALLGNGEVSAAGAAGERPLVPVLIARVFEVAAEFKNLFGLEANKTEQHAKGSSFRSLFSAQILSLKVLDYMREIDLRVEVPVVVPHRTEVCYAVLDQLHPIPHSGCFSCEQSYPSPPVLIAPETRKS